MIELNLLESVWCGDDEKEKKKKGKANKKQKKINRVSGPNTTRRKGRKWKGLWSNVLPCGGHFLFFSWPKKGR
jgi:hypothetical protein